jgi:hypothetical protein
MKKLLIFFLLVSVVPVASAVIWESDMSSLEGWGQGSNATDEYDPGGGGIYLVDLDSDTFADAVQYNSWADSGGGQAGWTDSWYNTQVVIEDETEYIFTVSMVSYASGTATPFSMQSIEGDVWSVIVSDSPTIAVDVFTDYSISFSTIGNGPNDNLVGNEIGIGISPGWWNNMAVDHASIVPEPATMLLLGLGALVIRKRS